MFQRMQDRIAQALIKRSITQNDDVAQYVILFVAILYCLLIHAYYLVVHAVFGLFGFTVVNAVSVLTFLVLLLFHQRTRNYVPTAIILSLEVGLYATFTAYMTGIDTYVLGHYVLIFILQIILPYGTSRLRMGMFGVTCVFMLTSLIFYFTVPPPLHLAATLHDILLVSNTFILAFGTMVELLMNNIVKRIVNASNEIRLAELTSLANTDPLTELYNRRYAEQYLAEILVNKPDIPYCVAMLDIDDFKKVNDTLGHPVGDEVLVFLARFLTEGLRKTDMVFRWGGEEMLLILENISLPTAHLTLDKLRRELSKTPIPTESGEVFITVTIGVSVLSLRNPQKSIEQCDNRLYKGKRIGKNTVVSTATLVSGAREKAAFEE